MTQITIDIQGIDAVKKSLDPNRVRREMKATMTGATDIVRRELEKYPPRNISEQKRKAHWANMTPKAKRYFWATLRDGRIQVPYVRGSSPGSEKLGASWTKRVRWAIDGIEGIIGTNVSYARYVMDEERQATIHQGRWQTIQERVKKVEPKVQKFFENAIGRWMR